MAEVFRYSRRDPIHRSMTSYVNHRRHAKTLFRLLHPKSFGPIWCRCPLVIVHEVQRPVTQAVHQGRVLPVWDAGSSIKRSRIPTGDRFVVTGPKYNGTDRRCSIACDNGDTSMTNEIVLGKRPERMNCCIVCDLLEFQRQVSHPVDRNYSIRS